jgi:hypothetical protein
MAFARERSCSKRAVDGLTGLISALRAPEAEVLRFPPVTNRSHIEKSGYLHSFPHLLGAVCCLHGGESEVRAAIGGAKDWVAATTPTDLVLNPGRLLPALSAGGLARPHCGERMLPPTASATNPRMTSTAFNRSACASSCAWARPIR